MKRSYWRVALILAMGAATRVGAQATPKVSAEFNVPRGQTIVEMAKIPLDSNTRLGAFYGFAGHVQEAPAPGMTLHIVRTAPTWAFAYDHSVMLLLDGTTRIAIALAQRTATVGDGYALEQVLFPVSRQQASQIAQAHKVEMRVGSSAFVWSDSLQQAFREMVATADGGAR